MKVFNGGKKSHTTHTTAVPWVSSCSMNVFWRAETDRAFSSDHHKQLLQVQVSLSMYIWGDEAEFHFLILSG